MTRLVNLSDLIPDRPIVADMFSGVGGISLGFEMSGFFSAVHLEVEEQAARYGAYNFPLGTHLSGPDRGDIRKLGARDLESAVGGKEIAVIVGGPPCQGFSRVGLRRVDDPLNDLVLEMAQLILDTRPMSFVIENVGGSQDGQYWQFTKALDMLASAYAIHEPTILRAEDYGVPQQRRRVFTVGVRDDLHVTPRLPQPTHSGKVEQLDLFLVKTPTVGDAIFDLPNCDDYDDLFDGDQVHYDKQPTNEYSIMMRDPLSWAMFRGYSVDWDGLTCTNLRRTRHGNALTDKLRNLEPGSVEKSSRIPKLKADGLSVTIRAGTTAERGAWSAPRPCHPVHPRVLTTRECARIQSFPDWFRFHPVKWHGNRQVGNAVPPLLAKAIGDCLFASLGFRRVDPIGAIPVVKRDFGLIADDIVAAESANYRTRRASHQVVNTDRKSRDRTRPVHGLS